MEDRKDTLAPVMSLKDWLIVNIIMMIPLVGFIMLLIWSFSGNETNENKRNWARSILIIQIVTFILVIMFYVIIIVGGYTMYKVNS